LERTFIAPLDGLRRRVAEAERALVEARARHEAETAALWADYQMGYERHLRPDPEDSVDEEPAAEPVPPDETGSADADADAESGETVEPLAEDEATESERKAEVTS
ncbi:MAG TPA: hypothetical protein VE617_15610, partial [Propionibacteriaceae bacterium]|nr:hypothetical protein [Propionibacteriaceae bacterium]